jgi:hypothetical protein
MGPCFHTEMLDELVPGVVQSCHKSETRVRIVDDEPQRGTAGSVLSQGDLDDVVRWIHVGTHRTVVLHMRVLISTQVYHGLFS